jgi:hypothetical protein
LQEVCQWCGWHTLCKRSFFLPVLPVTLQRDHYHRNG